MRMIEIDRCAQGSREPAQVLVVRVMLKVGDLILADTIKDLAGDGCLARARTAGNANDQRGGVTHGLIIAKKIAPNAAGLFWV